MEAANPLVEITEVRPPEADGPVIAGCSLGRPVPGAPRPELAGTFSFEVQGWVIGARLPARRVFLSQDGTPLWEVTVDEERPHVTSMFPGVAGSERPGFFASVSALPLPREFDLRLTAVLGDGSETIRAPLGGFSGRRAALDTAHDPRYRPLMVTGFSRTGSNVFLRLLGEHPQVIAYRPFQFESRVTNYWVDVLRELAEPSGYRRQITPRGVSTRGWWLGDRTPMPWPYHDPAVEREMGGSALGDIAELALRRVDAVCKRLAAECDRSAAVYLAEKQLPSHVPTMLWDLYPGAREVFLVRDFRDMVASMIAANRKWGGRPKFGRDTASSDEDHVRRFRRFAADLVASWGRRAQQAHLVRYEDLIQRPRETVTALVDYLQLDGSAATVGRMADSLGERNTESDRYRTTDTAEASIGRWRRDLSAPVLGACDDVFGAALELFGYAPR